MPIDRATAESNPYIPGRFEGNKSVERPKILEFFRNNDSDASYSAEEIAEGTGIEMKTLKLRLGTMCRDEYKGRKLDNLLFRSTVEGVTYFGLTDKGKSKIGASAPKKKKKE